MSLGEGGSCSRLCEMTDSVLPRDSIYAYDPHNLSIPAPLNVYKHPQACYGSFYIRLAVSPDSRSLASGSSDGAVYAWDVHGTGGDGVRWLGHEKEVGCVDWGHNQVGRKSLSQLIARPVS